MDEFERSGMLFIRIEKAYQCPPRDFKYPRTGKKPPPTPPKGESKKRQLHLENK